MVFQAKCSQFVDKYVEWDHTLIFIDLVLMYPSAYRHVLLHVTHTHPYYYVRLAAIFLICGAYDRWIERRAAELPAMPVNSTVEANETGTQMSIYDLEWKFYESVIQSAVEMAVYTLSLWCMVLAVGGMRSVRRGQSKREYTNWRYFAECTLMGFYGELAVIDWVGSLAGMTERHLQGISSWCCRLSGSCTTSWSTDS